MRESLSTPARNAYDPLYDPLRDAHPGIGRSYAPTFWLAAAGEPPGDDGPVTQDLDADVVIVGSGFTGLTCALFLAREHGIKASVLEANRVAWGCSTRNGGQGQNASGRLTRGQWIARWGEETALQLHAEIREGFERFTALTQEIDCDAQAGGHLYIAHRQRTLERLRAECELSNRVFGYKTKILDRATLDSEWVREAEAVGALHEPLGTGVNPAKLAFGYLRAARAAGAKVHPASPVLNIERQGNVFRVRTPGGTVRARAVVIATGGYTGQGLHKTLRSKIMPILSNSMVTRPLTPDELEATGFRTRQVITDTRVLRYYYRLLPENRLQIGSRSAITGRDAANPKHLQVLTEGLARKFPALAGIQIDYSWWGWVDVSHDMMPRIVQPHPGEPLFYGLGYGGNGVSYSAQAGWRLAELAAGKPRAHPLPIYTGALKGHMFAPFRRLGQRMLYELYQRRDEKPDAP
ncbi:MULTISPECIES: FAD-binding oxidoreductase [unclassified Acidocella]|uniref:NAD(P)/FAD-dependent oxidoreductase n=1 Tax=unclassified Acidocella TaxID=2648610 RepID=UPI00028D0368|nr:MULTISPECIES: FAD-binding oxidoreductase [unclassified Acidocella]EKM98494.1 FAD dependent oxidoreductase [Acidocella sp. MX-AZ02]WBO59123.1 FAD-binding oxidoreductase [Acidocella sp. MX-AZ03]